MNDCHRMAHFDAITPERLVPSARELIRIRETADLVPSHWLHVVDVGCGDGRVSRELIARGHKVFGIDWSNNSLKHFQGEKMVCDIRKAWPMEMHFDGAICCEVLEHLSPSEAAQVVQQIQANTRLGCLVTVPACEPYRANLVPCHACGKDYHIWGHRQVFGNFGDVDRMIGVQSGVRRLISPPGGVHGSERLSLLQRRLGYYPYQSSYLCQHCGAPQRVPEKPNALNWVLNKGIALLQRLGSPFRFPGGWYACRYDFKSGQMQHP